VQDHRRLCLEMRLLPKKEVGSSVHCAPRFPKVPERPFQITSTDITGPYPLTPQRNKYLLLLSIIFLSMLKRLPYQNRRRK